MKIAPIRFPKLLPIFGGSLAIAYVSACLFLLLGQNHFIFYPSPVIKTTPEAFNLKYQEVWLSVTTSSKTERIHGWWIPASGEETKVLLYLHGNGINIGANVAHANRFHQLGFSVLLIDYRGYGRSEGAFPTESSVYQDARTAWNYLVGERRVPKERIFIYGHSLGGAIAIDLAVQHPEAAGAIVESSFTSIRKMTDYKGNFWMFPTDLLVNQRFDSISKVRSLQMPVLFVHGTADIVVPYQMSQMLFAAAPEPKQLILFRGAGHNNTADIAGSQYFQAVRKFVEQVQTRQAQLAER